MTSLKMSRVALANHKAAMYQPLCDVLGRLCGVVNGCVYFGKKPSSERRSNECAVRLADQGARAFVKKLYLFHKTNDLSTADSSKLMGLISDQEVCEFPGKGKESVGADVFEKLKYVFNYDGFRDGKCPIVETIQNTNDIYFHWGARGGGKGRSWGAGRFIKSLGIRYCPYCNADTVYSSVFWRQDNVSRDKVIQSELDHFMHKGRYPYLAISLYNLIPSCRRCNGSVKGTEDITFDNCLYPYRDDICKTVAFFYEPGSAAAFHGVADDRNLDLIVKNRAINEIEKDRTDRFLRGFRTQDVYQSLFADEIICEYQRFIESSTLFDNVLRKLNPALSQRERNQLVLRRSLEPEDINQVRFGKVFMDLLG